MSTPTNRAPSVVDNCIWQDCFSRYISEGFTSADDVYMDLDYSCSIDSPDFTTPAPGTVTRTLINAGIGVIEQDPEMVNPTLGNFNLTVNSPCIATGDPSILGNLDGTRSDMGWIDYVGLPKSFPIVDIASSGNNTLEMIEELLIDYEESDGYIG